MAKVYSSPIPAPDFGDYDGPDGRFNIDQMTKVDNAYKAQLLDWIKTHNFKGKTATPLLGKTIRFPVADGYAEYMVAGNSCLVHLPLMDAWSYQYVDRLTAQDIKNECGREDKLNALFGR